MRVLSGFFCVLFVIAAVVQWNDPDPLLWIVGYLIAAGLSGAAMFGRGHWAASALASGLYLLWFLTLASSLTGAESAAFQSFKMSEASHEEPREAIGLVLCAAWCAILAWRAKNEAT